MHHPDIDLDFADRDKVLELFKHHPACIVKDQKHTKHNSGVYVTPISTDPRTGVSTIDHKKADQRGYFKLDFLNVHVYDNVRDEDHLDELIQQPPSWSRLWTDEIFCSQVIHIHDHFELVKQMKPDTIARMAMLLAIRIPSKRHLIGKTWKEISKTVWDKPDNGQYYFKKAHSVAYSQLVAVHMNLLEST